MKYISNSPEETYKAAADFAARLKPGDVIALDGDLGAGKTAFTRGIADCLGISDAVVSPTFTIVNEYRHGAIPLFHFDVYRIGSADELYDIGWEEYAGSEGICIVEWADIVPECFFMPHYEVRITKNLSLSENYREITVEFTGGAS